MSLRDLIKKDKKELENRDTQENTYAARFYTPNVDIFENESEIFLQADIPGVDKKNVEVTLENNILKIDAKITPDEYKALRPIYTEYNLGHYHREFKLGEKIDQDSIKASVENGVLNLVLKKSKELQSRRISVN